MSCVLVRGGGGLARGVALCLYQSGLPIMISELPKPLAVGQRVSFTETAYNGSVRVEDCMACRVDDPRLCFQISDKSLAAAEGALKAIRMQFDLLEFTVRKCGSNPIDL
jgi:hypothetical protein